jgi:biopolymer transport protein ExbB
MAAAPTQPDTLLPQEIIPPYENIKAIRAAELETNRQREARFIREKSRQAELLKALQAEYAQKLDRFNQLKTKVSATDAQLAAHEKQLAERAHNLRDLFSIWRTIANDSLVNLQGSLLSSQSAEAIEHLQQMTRQKTQPDSANLLRLAEILQQDIVNTGKIASYPARIALADGRTERRQVERIGPFTATSAGQFLHYDSRQQSLSVAPRQPGPEFVRIVSTTEYQAAFSADGAGRNGAGGDDSVTVMAVIDPSRGIVLDQLALSPTLQERLQQGGLIGYAIIALGMAGLLLALSRWLAIARTKARIDRQLLQPDRIDPDNPLGRILAAYQHYVSATGHDEESASAQSRPDQHHQTETLEVRLQEIVLQEMPKLDKGLGTLKLLAAIAPLLGLLGTVVGMINTFQTITLVGAADPKLMAGGISQALITTVLGLIVAVPLLFSHGFVAAKSRALMIFLSQQSLGYIAQSLESPPEAK